MWEDSDSSEDSSEEWINFNGALTLSNLSYDSLPRVFCKLKSIQKFINPEKKLLANWDSKKQKLFIAYPNVGVLIINSGRTEICAICKQPECQEWNSCEFFGYPEKDGKGFISIELHLNWNYDYFKYSRNRNLGWPIIDSPTLTLLLTRKFFKEFKILQSIDLFVFKKIHSYITKYNYFDPEYYRGEDFAKFPKTTIYK